MDNKSDEVFKLLMQNLAELRALIYDGNLCNLFKREKGRKYGRIFIFRAVWFTT